MELEKIRSLAQLMGQLGLEKLTLEEGSDKLELRRPTGAAVQLTRVDAVPQTAVEGCSAAAAEPGLKVISSPMVGVFYPAPSPSEQAFVTVGQQVRRGDVLCIIEAMKLMNEITAEDDGVITEVFAGNGQLVEFGQPLFRMRCTDES